MPGGWKEGTNYRYIQEDLIIYYIWGIREISCLERYCIYNYIQETSSSNEDTHVKKGNRVFDYRKFSIKYLGP